MCCSVFCPHELQYSIVSWAATFGMILFLCFYERVRTNAANRLGMANGRGPNDADPDLI
jgi:hypothetical protein